MRRLLLIVKPYSASEMFVTHNIPSLYELLSKYIYSFRELPSYLPTRQSDNGGDQYCINFNIISSLVLLL